MFKSLKNRIIMIYHPSLGYFADEFGLSQFPIEIEGKEPGAKTLHHITEFAKENGLKYIFVQDQFSYKTAKKVAQAIDGELLMFNPLAFDYPENMMKIAAIIKKAKEHE